MAIDKLVDSAQLDSDLTSVADAIREKGGTTDPLEFPNEFISAIGNITTGEDIPVFTVVHGGLEWDLVSASCNKTYSECVALISSPTYNSTAEFKRYERYSGSDHYLDTFGAFGFPDYGASKIYFYETNGYGISRGKYIYNSNGTITYTEEDLPVNSTLDAYANGTYYADYGERYETVNVAIPSGTEGTPTATKGTVSNHSVSVTPSVTNTAGVITGGTKTGTAVTVSASELVSGTLAIDSSGTKDVTNYASASVPSGSVTAPATISGTSASVSTGTNTLTLSKTVSVTPSVTTAGYISSGTAGNSDVSLTASVSTRSSTDLTVSGATVTAPAGYYSSSASKSVASGTAGTPTATKGTVSNHTISVTPSVTNTTGYITGGTKTGTAVTVQASELVSGTKSITTNGTGIDVANYSTVDVAVSGDVPVYQAKTGIVPTENSQTITADTGYDALSSVQIDAIDSDYVGSGITRRSSTDMTVSGATVTAPAGYYSSGSSKSVASGSATTPATTVTANPSISVNSSGLITATASATKSVTPTVSAGYVSSGTAGTITVSGSNTQQLSTQAATTYHPSTTDQTIASGKYLTGAQTIKAVTTTNLTAENILSGVTVKIGDSTDDDCVASVTGTASGGGGIVVVETTDEHGGTIVEITGEEVKLQAKTNISPTTSSQTIEPDNGYTGLSRVQINAMPTGSATAPNSISGTSATVSTGTNTLTLAKTVSVTPSVTAGYVASGTAGNSSVSLTASVTTKAAATITPTKSTQTIASGTYLTGTQTIAAIPAAYQDVTGVTAAAGDVVSGKDIVNSSGTVVHGSLVIQHYYTGSSAPSASLGADNDIYLQT